MASTKFGAEPWKEPWKVKDIVYLGCVGPVMVAAMLEWFLWLAAFCYCFVKAFKKADHWSQRVLSVVMMIIILLFRGIFLPITIVTLPLPMRLTHYFPGHVVWVLQQFAFYAFATLLVIPWFICILRILFIPLGRKKLVKWELTVENAPKVVVVMPVYKEPPDSLWRGLNSVVECDYPAACIHVFVSFDGNNIDELYLKTIDRLGIPITMKDFPKSINVTYKGAQVTISRFPHGGKRHCQKASYRLIDKVYKPYLQEHDDLFILFIDSDCILDKVCIQNFMWDMQLKPKSKHNMLAMTGVITCCTEKHSLITLLQDMEYIHGQLYDRSVESGCGAVTCLPGALTILRYSAFRNMAKFYFSDKAEHCNDLFDYGKTHLGEDRWLTHLFMLGAKKRYQIALSTTAFCKTEAVQTFRSLLKQRRRWFLGFITNEVCMLTDWRLWRKYPLLCLIRLMQSTVRTTSLLFMIMIISVASTSNLVQRLPWPFICASLGANWLMMLWFAFKIHRFKASLYPLMFLINPFMNWIYMVYGIFTAGQRTWGGPRADAGMADEKITPQAAVEQAVATGDDLNVKPETFRPSLQAHRRRMANTTLQPSASVEGRFVPAVQTPSGLYHRQQFSGSDSDIDMKDYRHSNTDSADLSDSDISIHTPRPINRSTVMTEAMRSPDDRNAGHLDNVADAEELSRRLSIIASSSSAQPSFQRSPLGRQSPLNASKAGPDETLAEVLNDGQRRLRTDQPSRRASTERRKLKKRSRSPATMV